MLGGFINFAVHLTSACYGCKVKNGVMGGIYRANEKNGKPI
jgi:hypothetical protein